MSEQRKSFWINLAIGAVIAGLAYAFAASVAAEGKEDAEPHWATAAVAAMNQNGIDLHLDDTLTRGEVAILLYQISQMVSSAPGLQMYQ